MNRPINWTALRRGAVIAPTWLGDAAMALPALRALSAATPACAWTILARPAVAPLFPLADFTTISLEPPPSLSWPDADGEIVIVLPNSWHSALLARRSPARFRVGYHRDLRGWLFTHPQPRPTPGSIPPHESFYYLELLRLSGALATLPDADPESLRVPLHPSDSEVAAWRAQLSPDGAPLIAIHAGASFGAAKTWLPERFAATAARLAETGAHVVLIGSPSERALAERVRAGRPDVVNRAGDTTLPQLAALLRACDRLIANDSGPMHLAAAVGTPVTAIFGSTNERETFPLTLAGRLRIVKAEGVACSPCKLRTCPIDHRCMTRIGVDDVLNEPIRTAPASSPAKIPGK